MEINPILNQKLRMDSEKPLYTQLIDIMRRAITSGEAEIGQLLPSEAELCKAYGISRNTVRQAIGALEEDGFVVRKRGKGTFVADPATRRKNVEYSFTTEITRQGKAPSSTLINFDVIPVTPRIREIMQLPADARVYCFTRVRNADGKPLIVEISYYPEYVYPGLTRDMLQTDSFYSLLYHVGIVPVEARDSYEAVALGDREAALLGCRSGAPAFYHQRQTTGEDGLVYEYTTSYMRADRMRLNVHFQKGATEFTRVVDL